jgi:hypothetical protein
MMALVNRLWLVLILYTGYDVYEKYSEHKEKVLDIESRKIAAINKVAKNMKKVN